MTKFYLKLTFLLPILFSLTSCKGAQKSEAELIREVHNASLNWINDFSNQQNEKLISTFEFPPQLSAEEVKIEESQLARGLGILRELLGEVERISAENMEIPFDVVFGFGPGDEQWILSTVESAEFNYYVKTENYGWLSIKFVYPVDSIQRKLIRKVVLGGSKEDAKKIRDIERRLIKQFSAQ